LYLNLKPDLLIFHTLLYDYIALHLDLDLGFALDLDLDLDFGFCFALLHFLDFLF
jgi:hypothetical protein